ncbi:hypothetical protein Aau02nite_22530 [Amorphoplanes auranticolor]|uniref:Uncharacterized protein n=1 Tax=Actinoplanes auranticolor TaxID=47988 RepID=A0A919S7K8_9ACTN|nr:hypothetical protein Aau02nite_22530 [Actinoplanes auranticolor]
MHDIEHQECAKRAHSLCGELRYPARTATGAGFPALQLQAGTNELPLDEADRSLDRAAL